MGRRLAAPPPTEPTRRLELPAGSPPTSVVSPCATEVARRWPPAIAARYTKSICRWCAACNAIGSALLRSPGSSSPPDVPACRLLAVRDGPLTGSAPRRGSQRRPPQRITENRHRSRRRRLAGSRAQAEYSGFIVYHATIMPAFSRYAGARGAAGGAPVPPPIKPPWIALRTSGAPWAPASSSLGNQIQVGLQSCRRQAGVSDIKKM